MIKNLLFVLFASGLFWSCIKSECPLPEKGNSQIVILNNKVNRIVLEEGNLTEDAFLSSFYLNLNYGADYKNYCTAWTYSGIFGEGLFLLKFKFGNIGVPQKVKSAMLSLFVDTSNVFLGSPSPNMSHYGSNLDLVISNLESDWSESSVTYSLKPSASTVNFIEVSGPATLISSCVNIDVTALVKKQLDLGVFGFEVRLKEPTIYKRVAFYSSNSPNVTYRPMLEIVYEK